MTPIRTFTYTRPDDLETAFGGIDSQASIPAPNSTDAAAILYIAQYGFNELGERVLRGDHLRRAWAEVEQRLASGELNRYTGADPLLCAFLALTGRLPLYYQTPASEVLQLQNFDGEITRHRVEKRDFLSFLSEQAAARSGPGRPGLAFFA